MGTWTADGRRLTVFLTQSFSYVVRGNTMTWTDLRAAPLSATTDRSGHFTLPSASLAGALPERFELGPNYPNPFNPCTMIPYQLPEAMQVRLEVFNSLGQRIATVVDNEQPAGFHIASKDATIVMPTDALADEEPVLAALTAASVRGTIATGTRAGQRSVLRPSPGLGGPARPGVFCPYVLSGLS